MSLAVSLPPRPARPAAPASIEYVAVPQRLTADLRDTPLAIGLYALIGRLFLVYHAPIPLSRADVLLFDPTLKVGAVKRAFDRLVAGGWLITASSDNRKKQRYTPSWGAVKETPLPWRMDQPCLGRPRHIARLIVDRGLLDICMGKLSPHATHAATVTRYITTPALSLADVGCYALTLAELPQETPGLRWLGLVRDGRALPLPTEQRLLALLSQRPLTLEDADAPDTALTLSGTRRLGLIPLPPPQADQDQPLFFVPRVLIGNWIGTLIGQTATVDAPPAAPGLDAMRSDVRSGGITWESSESSEENPPLAPPQPATAGGGSADERSQKRAARAARRPSGQAATPPPPQVPETETTRLLAAINVRPEQRIELAEMPSAQVQAAIADGQAREGIRDLAGWVVSLLRTHRDHGWTIRPPAPRSDSPEALAAAFTRYAAEQEVTHRAGLPAHAPWFLPPAPALLDLPGALQRLWNEVQAALKLRLTRREFDSWIRHALLREIHGGVATIAAPNATVKEAIERRYLGPLRDLLTLQAGEPLAVRIVLNGACREQPAEPAPAHPPAAAPEPADRMPALEPTLRPDWIAAERWAALPAMLRAALLGSTLLDGAPRCRSSDLDSVLSQRYAREIAELLATQANPGRSSADEPHVAAR